LQRQKCRTGIAASAPESRTRRYPFPDMNGYAFRYSVRVQEQFGRFPREVLFIGRDSGIGAGQRDMGGAPDRDFVVQSDSMEYSLYIMIPIVPFPDDMEPQIDLCVRFCLHYEQDTRRMQNEQDTVR
jgi:hypothetical protein